MAGLLRPFSAYVVNWKGKELLPPLSRAFDYGIMKSASNRLQNWRQFPLLGEPQEAVQATRYVANTFAQLNGSKPSRPQCASIAR